MAGETGDPSQECSESPIHHPVSSLLSGSLHRGTAPESPLLSPQQRAAVFRPNPHHDPHTHPDQVLANPLASSPASPGPTGPLSGRTPIHPLPNLQAGAPPASSALPALPNSTLYTADPTENELKKQNLLLWC